MDYQLANRRLRQAASLHPALSHRVSSPSASLPLAGMKFVPHNTPAYIALKKKSHFTASGKVIDRRMKRKGYTSEAF